MFNVYLFIKLDVFLIFSLHVINDFKYNQLGSKCMQNFLYYNVIYVTQMALKTYDCMIQQWP